MYVFKIITSIFKFAISTMESLLYLGWGAMRKVLVLFDLSSDLVKIGKLTTSGSNFNKILQEIWDRNISKLS